MECSGITDDGCDTLWMSWETLSCSSYKAEFYVMSFYLNFLKKEHNHTICRHSILLSNQLSEKTIHWPPSSIRIVKPLIYKIRVQIEEGKKESQRDKTSWNKKKECDLSITTEDLEKQD